MQRNRKRVLLASCGIAVAICVMAVKYYAYLRTGSVALYSDALESIVNVVTAVLALMAVVYSARPADRDHPFGHHKAEYFSAVIEGVLVLLAAVFILREAYHAWWAPVAVRNALEGAGIAAIATTINIIWATMLLRFGKRWAAPALVASGWHVVSDVFSSIPVLAGVIIAGNPAYAVVDAVVAVGVAGVILWSGLHLVRQSTAGLMDVAAAAKVLEDIRGVIASEADGAIEVHDLRTRVAGSATFIEFHLVVPGDMTVSAAHRICDRVEDALRTAIEGARILIHVEPEEKAKHQGVLVL